MSSYCSRNKALIESFIRDMLGDGGNKLLSGVNGKILIAAFDGRFMGKYSKLDVIKAGD